MTITIGTQTSRITLGGRDKLKYPDLWENISETLSVPNEKGKQYARAMARKGRRITVKDRTYMMNQSGEFATGFLYIVQEAIEYYAPEVQVTIIDERRNIPKFVKAHTTTPEYELSPHQVEMVESLNHYVQVGDQQVYFPRGVWRVAPNGGKTGASYCVIESFTETRALFLVDRQELFDQTIQFFEQCYGVGNVGKVGKIKSKYVYDVGYKVDVAMVPSLWAKMEKDLNVAAFVANNYGILIVDECHTTASGNGGKLIQRCHAGVRLFMSGSPFKKGDKYAGYKLVGMSGNKLKDIARHELVAVGRSLRAKVKIYYNGPYTVTPFDYAGQVKQVVTRSEYRAKYIAKLISNRSEQTIIINFKEKLHGYFMYDIFCKKYPHLAKYAAIVYGDHPERKSIITRFANKEIRYLFTSEILRQGINIAHIRTIIFAQAGKSNVDMTQFAGRIERLDGIHDEYEFLDFWDDCPVLAKQSRMRIRYYQSEKMDLEFKYNCTKAGTPKRDSSDDE